MAMELVLTQGMKIPANHGIHQHQTGNFLRGEAYFYSPSNKNMPQTIAVRVGEWNRRTDMAIYGDCIRLR